MTANKPSNSPSQPTSNLRTLATALVAEDGDLSLDITRRGSHPIDEQREIARIRENRITQTMRALQRIILGESNHEQNQR